MGKGPQDIKKIEDTAARWPCDIEIVKGNDVYTIICYNKQDQPKYRERVSNTYLIFINFMRKNTNCFTKIIKTPKFTAENADF